MQTMASDATPQAQPQGYMKFSLPNVLADEDNPLGYIPHVTLTWFWADALAQLQSLPVTSQRVRVVCEPFTLTSEHLVWESL